MEKYNDMMDQQKPLEPLITEIFTNAILENSQNNKINDKEREERHKLMCILMHNCKDTIRHHQDMVKEASQGLFVLTNLIHKLSN